jgi:hypothetical protein
MKYVHSKGSFIPYLTTVRTRRRVDADFNTLERVFSLPFPSFGAPLGVGYDGVTISKVNRARSISG